MTATELLREFRRLGVVLHLEGDDLVFRAAAGLVTPALRDAIAASKPEIVARLRGLPAEPAAWPEDWQELYAERAAIREFDGGFDRAEAERRAEQDCRRAFAEGRR